MFDDGDVGCWSPILEQFKDVVPASAAAGAVTTAPAAAVSVPAESPRRKTTAPATVRPASAVPTIPVAAAVAAVSVAATGAAEKSSLSGTMKRPVTARPAKSMQQMIDALKGGKTARYDDYICSVTVCY